MMKRMNQLHIPLVTLKIANEQKGDALIKRLMQKSPNRYVVQERKFSGTTYKLVTRENKIVLPTSMQRKAVEWYHQILCHPGETRTELTMPQHFCWKGMQCTTLCKMCAKGAPHVRQIRHCGRNMVNYHLRKPK